MPSPVDLSVVMPTYRRPEFLREALESVLTAPHLNLEVLVFDDSPDGEGEPVVAGLEDLRIRYIRRPVPTGGRPAVLRNEGARLAQGQILYFMDDDDIVASEALPAAVAALIRAPAGVAISVPVPFGNEPQRVAEETAFFAKAKTALARRPSAVAVAAHLALRDPLLVSSACLVKRSVHFAIGGWDETLELCEDMEYYARAVVRNGWRFEEAPLVRRRVGHTTLSASAASPLVDSCYARMRAGFRARHGALAYFGYRLKFKLLPDS